MLYFVLIFFATLCSHCHAPTIPHLFLSLSLSCIRLSNWPPLLPLLTHLCSSPNMAALALAVLLLALTGSSSAVNWCVCKDGGDAILQKTLDYACGAGADCNPIHQNAPCFQPNNVRAHCNYAVNSYFQKKGQGQGSCDFAGTATIVTSDPSTTGCVYPSSASTAGTSTTPVSTTPTTVTPSTGTPSTGTPSTTTGTTTPSSTTSATPYSATPGVLGGIGNGMGPSGSGMNTDDSRGGLRLVDSGMLSALSMLLFSGLMML